MLGKLCFMCGGGGGGGRSIASETWLTGRAHGVATSRLWERGRCRMLATPPDQLLAGPLYKFKTGGKNVTVFRAARCGTDQNIGGLPRYRPRYYFTFSTGCFGECRDFPIRSFPVRNPFVRFINKIKLQGKCVRQMTREILESFY